MSSSFFKELERKQKLWRRKPFSIKAGYIPGRWVSDKLGEVIPPMKEKAATFPIAPVLASTIWQLNSELADVKLARALSEPEFSHGHPDPIRELLVTILLEAKAQGCDLPEMHPNPKQEYLTILATVKALAATAVETKIIILNQPLFQ